MKKELFKEKKPIPQPTREELRREEAEEDPYLVFATVEARLEELDAPWTPGRMPVLD